MIFIATTFVISGGSGFRFLAASTALLGGGRTLLFWQHTT
jgi:hypothetical protein